jgi:hypothetical protein
MFVDLRLHDLLNDALLVCLLERFHARIIGPQSELVSSRMIRRKLAYSDTFYPRHPKQQNPFPTKHRVVAAVSDVCGDHDIWHCHSLHRCRKVLWIHPASIAILADSWAHAILLRCPHTISENMASLEEMDMIGVLF